MKLSFIFALRSLLWFAVACLFSGPAALAQAAAPRLVTQPVVDTQRVVLHGSVSQRLVKAADLGRVDDAMPAARMFVVLRRAPEREAALRAAIEALHNRNSPSFHKWMTPTEFGAHWGAADADIEAITTWLQSYGLVVSGPTRGRTMIEFSGNAGQVREAFRMPLHAYRLNGEVHHANAADPQIPEALAPAIAVVSTFNDFHPRPGLKQGPRGIYNASKHKLEPDSGATGAWPFDHTVSRGARPELTASGSYGDYLYVGPADAATIYNSPIPQLNPSATGASVDGTGAVIGIVGDSSISTDQLANYRTLFGLAASAVTVIQDGDVNPGENHDAVEAYLDTEIAGGIAPGAQIDYYVAADTNVNYGVDLAASRAVNDNLVDVLNLSFGECEAALGSGNAFYEGLWEQAAAQGISVTVSAGDAGAAGCDDANTQSQANYGLQVNGLASTPYDLAVGGTDFAALAGPDGTGADFTNYVSETSDPTTLRSALGAIPEVPWNDAIASFPPTVIAASVPYSVPYANIVAGGGGKSGCLTSVAIQSGFSCADGYPKPSWQSAPGVPADGVRDLPDISLFAANGLDYSSWGICTDQDEDTAGNAIEDCTMGSNGLPSNEFYIYGVGGTSASAPAMAGILALVRQQTGQRQGVAGYTLYSLARSAPSIFRDITTGNNSVPCAADSADCAVNGEGVNLLTGYNADAGYDLASGLGSVDVTALLANWSSPGLASSTTLLTLAPTSIEHGQSVQAEVTVTASPGVTVGQVAVNAIASPPSLPAGVAIGNYPLLAGSSPGSTGILTLGGLPGGSYQLSASFGGSDSVAQSSSPPVSIQVAPEASSTQIAVLGTNPATLQTITGASMPYGFTTVVEAQPYGNRSSVAGGVLQPDGLATGTVTFTEDSQNIGREPVGLQGYAAMQRQLLAPGSHTIQAVYSGDNSFDPNTGSYMLTVGKGNTSVLLSASQTDYTGQPVVFTIMVGTTSVGVAPTGTVEVKFGATVLGSATLAGSDGSSNSLAQATATISIANTPPGTASLQAVYLGDSDYAGAASNAISVTGKATFTIDNVGMSLPNGRASSYADLTVNSEGGYTGTVQLTCGLLSEAKTVNPPHCAISPASVTLTGEGKAKTRIYIFGVTSPLATSRSGKNRSASGRGANWPLAAAVFLAIPVFRRRRRILFSVLLVVSVSASITACGGSGKSIAPGEYQFQVVGVDSAHAGTQTTATVSVQVY